MSTKQFISTFVLMVTVALAPQQATANDAGGAHKDELLVWTAQNFGRLLARATNDEAIKFAVLYSETANHLVKVDPGKCLRMVMPNVFGPLRPEEWPQEFIDKQMAIQRRIVRTALTSPNTVPGEAEAGPILDRVLQTLRSKHGVEATNILTRSDKNIPSSLGCQMWSRLYLETSKLPVDQGGVLVRWLNAP
jgi:hypothetical protein